MITRLHGRASTLVANPYRYKVQPDGSKLRTGTSAPAKRRKRRTARASTRLLPAGAHKVAYLFRKKTKSRKTGKTRTHLVSRAKLGRKKPAFTLYARGKGKTRHYGAQKNPRRNGDLVIAGVPVISMAVGSAGAIAAIAIINGFLNKPDATTKKTMLDSIPGFGVDKDGKPGALAPYAGALAPAALAAASAFAYKKAPAGMYKDVAKYAFIGSVFVAIQAVAGKKIEEVVSGKKAAGIYVGPNGQHAVGGMYKRIAGQGHTGGMFVHANGSAQADMGGLGNGLGLYKAKSIYG